MSSIATKKTPAEIWSCFLEQGRKFSDESDEFLAITTAELLGVDLDDVRRAVEIGREPVSMECPECGRSGLVPRDDNDPFATQKIVVQCTDCGDGDHFPIYLDAEGRELRADTRRG